MPATEPWISSIPTMPARRRPLDPLSPPEPEKTPEQLQNLSKQDLFQYAFNANSPHVRNLQRRRVQESKLKNQESQVGDSND